MVRSIWVLLQVGSLPACAGQGQFSLYIDVVFERRAAQCQGLKLTGR
jgi:hypothetical protein